MSHTYTYVVEELANPFLRCDQCGQQVDGVVVAPGHDLDGLLAPCHHLGVTSICPSWGPVDGCRCAVADRGQPEQEVDRG